MRITVLDTETTGIGEDDQVIELSVRTSEVRQMRVGDRLLNVPRRVNHWATLIRPSVPVKIEARSAHHITDEELAEAKTAEEVMFQRAGVPELLGDVVLVGHQMEFDLRLLAQSGFDMVADKPWIDTKQCAMHVWPEAGGYSNQRLRYWLGLKLRPEGAPHRASYDTEVTEALLFELLKHRSIEEMIDLTGRPALLTICNIGEWRGKPWTTVDTGMLRWILKKDFDENVMHTARYHLEQRAIAPRPTTRALP